MAERQFVLIIYISEYVLHMRAWLNVSLCSEKTCKECSLVLRLYLLILLVLRPIKSAQETFLMHFPTGLSMNANTR